MTHPSQQQDSIEITKTEGLKRSLTSRQLSMIGLGGAIGAGLFVGSGEAISVAGPAVVISYIVAGLIVILIMWMLGELVAEDPQPGAFSVFAGKAFGAVTGGTVGLLYWFQLVVVIAAEATAAAAIASAWLPQVHQGVWALGFLVVLTAVNLLGVRNYGNFEYWFSIIKVVAIIAFLAAGFAFLFGWFPDIQSPGMSNWTEHGGFAPGGLLGMSAALLIVIFSFGGTEVVAIAAAESENPAQGIRKAVRSVMWRILVFYIGSVFVIISILPWNSEGVASGPFVAVLQHLRIPGADVLMSILIVIALLSALNANLYGSSRMAFSLAERGFAPKRLMRLSGSGVPRWAVLASVAVGFITVIFNFIAADAVLPILLNLVGSTVLMVWLSVLASYYMLRVRGRGGKDANGNMNLRPAILTLGAAVLLGAVFVLALLTPGPREQLLATVSLTVVFFVALWLSERRRKAAAMR
ncbi:amino acid permease [Gulosibacter molinativorax]|uniref:Amino acid permease n=1 Tax=Gulosibacter molinativorax TaxID=256821 RepID=A0ABT7CAT3_9MICO|nr:amino acid permease [Gulosibacter molinativorax]MDJ1372305.1 amino acid permease [Gulosibacter molinativorax]QUY63399.1 GABA permease [Gulosibacter molinativorax]